MTHARKGIPLTLQQWGRARSLFESALDLPEAQRISWLIDSCGDDTQVRAEAEQLLAAFHGESIFDTPVGVLPTAHAVDPSASLSGRQLGPWKVIRPIGRGGMGEVWLAERADGAYEQCVAIKLLKRGLDTDAILDRFLRERRILARLSHPYIARLIDAGATEDGRPYLVMEHIDGRPVTEWCAAQALNLPARLTLFEQICEAVHAAHRQQIVHRDLKPSNVLVGNDGEVKLLDFGIAKLVGENDATQTSFGSTPATLHYGAPEQLLGEAVTSASDVYSLGVLLYELLTGELPHRHTSLALALHAAAHEDLTATRPSAALRQQAVRDITAASRARQIEGEVDWIVLKALQRDPARRYRTAAELADDIRRHLDHRPVLARPDSLVYRAGRFVRRHRLAVAAVVITVLSLAGGLTVAIWQAQRAGHEARRAEQVKNFLVSMFQQSNPRTSQRQDVPVRELLDHGAAEINGKLGDDPMTQADLYEALSKIELGILDIPKALNYADRSLQLRRSHLPADDPRIADGLAVHGHVLQQAGLFDHPDSTPDQNFQRAAAELEEANRLYIRAHGDHRLQRAQALKTLAIDESDLGQDARALTLHGEALQLYVAVRGEHSVDALNEQVAYADELALNGKRNDGEHALREAIAGLKALEGPTHSDVALADDRLSRVLEELDHFEESEKVMSDAIDINTRIAGADDEMVAAERVQRALTRAVLHRFADADADFAAALPILRPGTYPDAQYHDFHSTRFELQERFAEAAHEMQLATADYRAITSSGGTETSSAQSDQGLYTAHAGNAIEGERLIRDAMAQLLTIESEKSGEIGDSHRNLGIVLSYLGRASESEAQLRESLMLYQSFVSKDDNKDLAEFRYWIARDILDAQPDSSPVAAKIVEARDLAQQALKTMRGSREPMTSARALSLAARADRAAGDNERAGAEYREAIKILGDDLPATDAQFGAGAAVPSLHRYELARDLAALDDSSAGPLFDQAVTGLRQSAPQHCLLGNVLLDRAKWHLAQGDVSAARRDQVAAITAIMRTQGKDSIYLQEAQTLLKSS